MASPALRHRFLAFVRGRDGVVMTLTAPKVVFEEMNRRIESVLRGCRFMWEL
jgi:hypothetical protein